MSNAASYGKPAPAPTTGPVPTITSRSDGVATVQKTLSILEVVAERGGATAREVSDALGVPIPTVYRLLQELVHAEYLVHLKGDKRFELGYKLHGLGVSLHRQLSVPLPVRASIDALHEDAGVAAYFAVYRGADVVVAYVADCPRHPRVTPLKFGFHEAAHATAFGKIMLAGMSLDQRGQYLQVHGQAPLTGSTITDRAELDAHLATVSTLGIAWELEEFVPGKTCAAIGVRNAAGMVVGSVAISSDTADMRGREQAVERILRESSAQVSRYLRSGSVQQLR
jgi:IclR family acetate operon transcriptional repressor